LSYPLIAKWKKVKLKQKSINLSEVISAFFSLKKKEIEEINWLGIGN
jgi:hypothetical protein